jgi:di/tricarboxylate transporter
MKNRNLLKAQAGCPCPGNMVKTVIQFIIDNIFFILPLIIAGLLVTFYLYLTGKKETINKEDNLQEDYKKIGPLHINVFILFYLFAWVVLVLIGVLSDFLIPTLTNGLIALIPVLILILTRKYSHRDPKAKDL